MRLKWTLWDILGRFGGPYDEFGAFRLFSESLPTIFTHNQLIEKKRVPDGPQTHGPTDGQNPYRDGWTHLKTRMPTPTGQRIRFYNIHKMNG